MRKTCKEKIDKELKERIKDFKEALKTDDIIEQINSYALGIEEYKIYKLQLSWGGPADYIEFKADLENTLNQITYYYQDWYDGAYRNISQNSQEWKILEKIFYECILIK